MSFPSPSTSSSDAEKPNVVALEVVSLPTDSEVVQRDWRFWLIFLSISISTFVFALEVVSIFCQTTCPRNTRMLILTQCAVSTALPVIVEDLHGSEFVWVGAAYALAATACLPMSGGLAQVRMLHNTQS